MINKYEANIIYIESYLYRYPPDFLLKRMQTFASKTENSVKSTICKLSLSLHQ